MNENIQKNIQLTWQKIAGACESSRREVNEVKLVAVSKKVPAEKIRAAFDSGIRDFGENYMQEALAKMSELSDLPICWHMIGALQSNKIKQAAGRFELIHSIERMSILQKISQQFESDRASQQQDGTQKILIEINLAGEATKSGARIQDLPRLLEAAQNLKHVRLCGFMFMPPAELNELEQRRYFQKARELRDEMVTNVSAPHSLSVLSMGTSHDFEAAINEGATLVRIGTAIFGARNAK